MMDDDDDFFGSLGGGGSGGEMGMGMNMHVTLLRIGQTPDPKLGVALYIDPEVTLQTFLKKAAERLNVNEARQVLNVDGDVVDDFVLVNNREALYIVTDEDQDVNGTGLAQETARCDENGDALLGSDDNASETGTIGCGASQERVGSYILGKFLGSGSFGKVHIGTHIMTHEQVALKFLSKNQMGSTQDAERVFTEIQCLNSLDHPNVIKLLHVIQTPDDMVLALEFASGGDLKEVVEEGPLEEDLASRIFVQILEGVTYCHRHHIIHYDLKLENILLAETQDPHLALHATDPVVEPTTGRNIPSRVDESIGDHRDPSAAPNETAGDGQSIGTEDPLAARRKRLLGLQVKITDFGLSQLCNPGQTSEYTAGSLAYIAPEVFAAGETAGPPRDVWALGVILFTMVCGRLPFSGSTFQEVSEKIRRGTYSWESADASVSESFKQLIAGMLNTNPEERMTVSEVRLMSWIDRGLPHTRGDAPQPSEKDLNELVSPIKTARTTSGDEPKTSRSPISTSSRSLSRARSPATSPSALAKSSSSARVQSRGVHGTSSTTSSPSSASPQASPPGSPLSSTRANGQVSVPTPHHKNSANHPQSAASHEPRNGHQSHRRLLSSDRVGSKSNIAEDGRPRSSSSSSSGSGKRLQTVQLLERRPSTSGSIRSGASRGALPPLTRKGGTTSRVEQN